ncbi:sensor histidine kinase [Hephaestia mangrovi]|uniref:sensor histidine kinase n=1 Tax=Hephaestia mangrovi TaxID=2873268 RepID=UPI0034E24164
MFTRSLQSLTITFILLFLAVTTLGGVMLFLTTQHAVVRLAEERAVDVSESISPDGATADPKTISARIDDLSNNRDTGDLGMVLIDRHGREIAGNISFARLLPAGFSRLSAADDILGLTHGRAFTRVLPGGLRLIVIIETEPIDNYSAARARSYVVVFGTIIAVVIAGLLLFRTLVARRIFAMRQTVDAIIDGDLSRRVPTIGSHDAFDHQAAAFNRMLDRIGELMAEIRNVTNDLSHELRTPLARLRGLLAAIVKKPSAADIRDEIELALAEADGLLAMSAAMLRIAEIDSGQRRAGFVDLDLGSLVGEVVETLTPIAEDSGHGLAMARCEPAAMRGDRQLLVQMTLNLVENALRHTPRGTSISVGVTTSAQGVRLVVEDDGPGINSAVRDIAMRRFGRIDPHQNGAGHGLGLALVASIARLHQAVMMLEDADPGLRVVIQSAAA